MIAIYNFNENDATNVFDYAGNGNNAVSIAGFAVIAGELGTAGVFDGATTDLNFGNIADLGGTDTISIFCKIFPITSQEGVIAFKSKHFELRIDATENIVFKVYIGAADKTITSTGTLTLNEWSTVGVVYDGVKQYIYIDGVADNEGSQTGNMDASSEDLLIGNDTSSFYDGRIETIEINAIAYTPDNITARHNQPSGIKIEYFKEHGYALGDLLEVDSSTNAIRSTVTLVSDTKICYMFPIKGRPSRGDSPIRRGNIGVDTTRQWIYESAIVSDIPTIQIKDDVDTFAKSELANATSTTALKATKSGVEALTTTIGAGTKHDGWKTRNGAEVQTTDSTQTTIDNITLEDENTYMVRAFVVGVKSDGTDRASYHIEATVYRTAAGVATLQGAVTSVHTQESDATWLATFTVNSNDIRVSVTGVAATTIEWGVSLTYINMSN